MAQYQKQEKQEGVIYRLGAKLHLMGTKGIDFGDFIEVFNRWIQDQPIAGHLLIDVHDYRHVQHGPGVLLVGHQGNFSLDFGEGRPGLVYYRKQPLGSDLSFNLRAVLATLVRASRLLQDSSRVELKFATGEVEMFANDRLLAPNQKDANASFQEAVSGVLQLIANGNGGCSTAAGDPREHLVVTLKFPDLELDSLLKRLED